MAAWQYGGYFSTEASLGFSVPSYDTARPPATTGDRTGQGPWAQSTIPAILPPPLSPPNSWFHGPPQAGYPVGVTHFPSLPAYGPPLPELGSYSIQQHQFWVESMRQVQGLDPSRHPLVPSFAAEPACPPAGGVPGRVFTLERGNRGFIPRSMGPPSIVPGRLLEPSEIDVDETGGVATAIPETTSERYKRIRTDAWAAGTSIQVIPTSHGVSAAVSPSPELLSPTNCPNMPGVAVTQAGLGGKQFWCPENATCKMAFTSVKKLQKHLRLKHHIDRPFQCSEEGCGAMLASRAALITHIRTHSGERPFKCDVDGCGASFSQNSNLKRHKATHENKKFHACSAPGCDEVFLRKGLLQEHLRTHEDFRPFACTVDGCNSRFRLRVGLTVHLRTHTGERPYPCIAPGCDKSFKTSSQLKRHELALHGPAAHKSA